MGKRIWFVTAALLGVAIGQASGQGPPRKFVVVAPVRCEAQTAEGLGPALAIEENVARKLGRLPQLVVRSSEEFKRLAERELPATAPDPATVAAWEQEVRAGTMTRDEFERRTRGESVDLTTMGGLRQAARRLRFDYMVTTEVYPGDQGRIRLVWSIVDCRDNSTLNSGDFVGSREDLLGLETSYAFNLAKEMAVPPSDQTRHILSYTETVNNAAHVAYYEGQALIRLKRFDEAVARFEQAHAADPNFNQPRMAVGEVYLARAQDSYDEGRIDDALKLVDQTIQALKELSQESTLARTYVLLARIRQTQGDAQGRIQALHEAGYAFVKAGDYEEVLSERGILQPLVSEGVDTAETHFIRGEAARRIQEAAQAEQEFLVALERDPKHLFTLIALGQLYRAQRRPDDAVRYLNEATTYAPDNARAWYELGRAMEASGAYDGAISAYQRSLDNLPQDSTNEQAEVLIGVGRCYLGKKDPKNAVEALQKALSLNNPSIEVEGRTNLALAYVDLHEFDSAAAEVDRCLRLAPGSLRLKQFKEQILAAREQYARTVGYEKPHRDERNPDRFGGNWAEDREKNQEKQ